MTEAPTRTYKLLPDALPEAERAIRTSYLPLLLTVLTAGLLASLFLGVAHGTSLRSILITAMIFAALMTYLALSISRRTLRNVRGLWNTFELEIGPNYLVRRQANLVDLRLPFEEIRRVEHRPGRDLRVVGTGARVIAIPKGIEDFQDVLRTVATIRSIQNPRIEAWQQRILLMAASFVGFLIMLWSQSLAVVAPLAVVMSGYFVWVFVRIRRNPNCSPRTRRLAWIYPPFVLVCAAKVLESIGRQVQR